MTVGELAGLLGGEALVAAPEPAREVQGGYASDLLSDVIAHAEEGDVWVTLHTHVNTVAVAQLKALSAIVVVAGRRPDADTLERACAERVVIVSTPLPAFEAVGALHAAGVRGRRLG